MPDTIRELIIKNIKTAVEAITVANGYENTITNVQRWDYRSNPLVDIPRIVIVSGPEQKDFSADPFYLNKFNVFLEVATRQTESDITPTDQILNSLIGDVIKAVMQDVTRGGYAIDTLVQSVEPYSTIDDQGEAGVTVDLLIKYEHLITSPVTAG